MLGDEKSDTPDSAVAIDGGDVWSGARATKDELANIVDAASSTTIGAPIIAQYYPARLWLWRKWQGTILRRVLPREVLINILFAVLVCCFFHAPGPRAAFRYGLIPYLDGVARVWTLSATMVSFTLSFFLSQAYSMWRSVYSLTRRVQGRLNDIGLLCATFATRDAHTASYTADADDLLGRVARYSRLFSMLFYASVSTTFMPLRTPRGLTALVAEGILTSEEREGLLESSLGHFAVLGWMSVLVDAAVADGRLGVSVSRARNTSPIAVQMSLQNKLLELRAAAGSLPDELSGRMPLSYVQLVQVLSDMLILFTPFALIANLKPVPVVVGTAVVTTFQTSIVTLAKLFLDPFSNEVKVGGDSGIGGIEVATLLQETNVGSERWRRSAGWVPEGVFLREPRANPAAAAALETQHQAHAAADSGAHAAVYAGGSTSSDGGSGVGYESEDGAGVAEVE